jgi:hypothetical protein
LFFLVKSCFFIENVHILRIIFVNAIALLVFGRSTWFRVGISVTFFKTDSPVGWGWALGITNVECTTSHWHPKLCPNVPWVILFQTYVQYVWGPIHHTCMTCLFFSFLLIYKTRPMDFDLQLDCYWQNGFRDMCNFQKKLPVGDGDDPGPQLLGHLICPFTLIINIYWFRGGDLNHYIQINLLFFFLVKSWFFNRKSTHFENYTFHWNYKR